jgi:hypothetical protein
MTVRMDLDLDVSDMQAKLQEDLQDFPGHRRAILLAVAENLVGGLKREVNTNTSRLQGTIRSVEADSNLIHVMAGGENGVDYTLPVLEGSDPHPPGSPIASENRSLARWADRVGYPGGFESIYWGIARYGTEEHDFVSPALSRTERQASGIMTQVARDRGLIS